MQLFWCVLYESHAKCTGTVYTVGRKPRVFLRNVIGLGVVCRRDAIHECGLSTDALHLRTRCEPARLARAIHAARSSVAGG